MLIYVGIYKEGLGIKALLGLLGEEVIRRSLQKVLAEMARAGRLHLEKRDRSSHYLVPAKAEKEGYISSSTSGAEVRRRVRRPLTERAPMDYRRESLRFVAKIALR